MTDNLRDRIAKALLSNRAGSDLYEHERLELADAVIAELGLTIQVAGPDGIVGTGDYRYVTRWCKADD